MEFLPVVDFGNKESHKIVVLLSGFPDNETSAWGDLLQMLISSFKLSEYRFVCMCLPDFQDDVKPKKWGWDVGTINLMIEKTINHYIQNDKLKFNLIVHDWGSIFGLFYENRNPHRINRMIAFDVGLGASSCENGSF